MKLGKKALEALQAEIDGQLKPGDELIVAGPVAAEGTAWITKNGGSVRSQCQVSDGGRRLSVCTLENGGSIRSGT